MGLIAAFAPIWGLAAAGYAARRWRLLGERAVDGLGWFVFHVAMPAAIFGTLVKTPIAGFDARPLIAFAASAAAITAAGWYGAGRFFGRKPAERAITGMASGYVNSANLGFPIALQVLGTVSFLVEVLLLQVLVISPVILTALDRHADGSGRVRVGRLLSLPVRNPVIMASALGIGCAAAGWRPAALIAEPLSLLSTAALLAALVALGATLYQPAPGEDARVAEIAMVSALKLLAQPLMAWAGAVLLGLPPAATLAVVVCAALPTAQNAFNFAQHYEVAAGLASRAVLVTTTLSLGTIAAAAALLGRY